MCGIIPCHEGDDGLMFFNGTLVRAIIPFQAQRLNVDEANSVSFLHQRPIFGSKLMVQLL